MKKKGISLLYRFIIIAALFLSALCVVGYFMIHAQNVNITNEQTQIQGLEYQKLLRQIKESVLKQQLILFYTPLSKKREEEFFKLQAEVSSHLERLISLDEKLQSKFWSPPTEIQMRRYEPIKPKALLYQWENLRKEPQKGEGLVTLYSKFLANLNKLIHAIADTNVVLTIDVDVFYFIETALIGMDTIFDNIEDILLTSRSIAIEGKESDENRAKLEVYKKDLIEHVQEAIDHIEKGYLESYDKGDTLVKQSLEPAVQEYLIAAMRFSGSIDLPGSEDMRDKFHKIINQSLDFISQTFLLWDAIVREVEQLINEREAEHIKQQNYALGIAIGCSLAAIILGFFVFRGISLPLSELINATEKLSHGDLKSRVPIHAEDEIGRVGEAFNQMGSSFEEVIRQLQRSGIQLTTFSTQIAAAAKEQESVLVQHGVTTREIAATAKQISSNAKQFAGTMGEISKEAESTSEQASLGKAGLDEMKQSMQQMVEASSSIAFRLQELSQKAEKITSVILTITKVADQTNLLSLNAALEAEKAGDYGKSFSVIAKEIRYLADQTAYATLDIEKMVHEVTSAVSKGVIEVDAFIEEIRKAVKNVNQVGEQLSFIIKQVEEQTTGFESVNVGIQNQSIAAEDIHKAITQLSESAQQSTESIRHFHNTIEELNQASKELRDVVSKFS